MIKFEEHDDRLFRILDKPTPLTPDAEMPCLVRLIQDDSPIGKQNKQDFHACVLAERTLVLSIDMETFPNTVNSYYEPFNQQYYWRFEIIGYQVCDGSHEWAKYSLLSGKKVRYSGWAPNQYIHMHEGEPDLIFDESNGIYCELGELRPGNYWEIYEEPLLSPGSLEWAKDLALKGVKITREGIEPDESFALRDDGEFWISKNGWRRTIKQYEDGWEIYEEPKQPKPLLADAQVGDLCKHRNGDWSQIIDTNGTYITQQPIRTTLKDTKGINRNFCLSGSHFIMQFGGEYDIIHTEPLAPEGSAEWAWQMNKLLGKKVMHSHSNCITDGNITRENKDMFLAVTFDTGWQLCEPKPELKYKVGDCRIEFVKQELYNLLDKL